MLGLLIELDSFEAAAVLHGGLTAVGAANALPIEPATAERLSEHVEQLRSLLGAARFAEAVRRGAALSDSEIVTFAKQQIALLSRESAAEPHHGRVVET